MNEQSRHLQQQKKNEASQRKNKTVMLSDEQRR